MAREKVYSVSHNECERTSIGTLEYVLSEKCEVCDEPFIEEEKSFCGDSAGHKQHYWVHHKDGHWFCSHGGCEARRYPREYQRTWPN